MLVLARAIGVDRGVGARDGHGAKGQARSARGGEAVIRVINAVVVEG